MSRAPRKVVGAVVIGALVGGCALAGISEPSRDEVLRRILPSAVQIVVEQQEGRRVRMASGVVLGARPTDRHPACFVLTAGHAVSGLAGQKGVYVTFGRYRGEARKAPATVLVYRDTTDMDLALLRVEADRCMPAPRGTEAPILGESVWVVGFPWGRHMTLASGIVSQINADDDADRETASQLMVDASVSYGSSGGGVYEARRGALIGVIKGYSTARVSAHGADPPWYIDVPVPGQTFVTPLTDVRRFLAQAGYADLIGGGDERPNPSGVATGRTP